VPLGADNIFAIVAVRRLCAAGSSVRFRPDISGS